MHNDDTIEPWTDNTEFRHLQSAALGIRLVGALASIGGIAEMFLGSKYRGASVLVCGLVLIVFAVLLLVVRDMAIDTRRSRELLERIADRPAP